VAPDLLSGLVAPALFAAAGAGLQALAPQPLESSFVARLGLAYLLGAAWCALTVWAASFLFGAPVGRVTFVAAGAVAVSSGLFAAAARGGDAGGWRRADRSSGRGRWAGLACGVASLALAATLLADALVHPVTDFDGRMTWGTAARYIQAERTALPQVLSDESAYVIHPRYPPVMPLLQVAAAELAGTGIESRAVRPLYALFYAALLAALWPLLARTGGVRAAALAVAAIAWAPALLWNHEVGPLGTYSDFALTAFLGAALALLLHPSARRQAWRGAFAGLLLAAAAGTKNEGLLLAPAVLAAAALAGRGSRSIPALRRAAVLFAAGLLLTLAWRAEIPNRNDEGYFEELSLSALAGGLVSRLPLMAKQFGRSVVDSDAWGALWTLPLLWLAGRRGARARAARAATILLAAQLVLVTSAYAVTPDLAVLPVTLDRFVMQCLAPLALLTAATGRAALLAARRRRS
jgi:hypothetical protein